MPGLIRGVARTAVIAGTATAVSNRVSRRQAGRWAAQDQATYNQYEQPVADQPSPADARLDQLRKLGELHEAGVLDDAEFQAQKNRILNY